MNKFFISTFLLISFCMFSQQGERKLTKEEKQMFLLANKYNNAIEMPLKALESESKVQYIFEEPNEDWSAGYSIIYSKDSSVLIYEMAVGTAYRSNGQVQIIEKDVIITDYSYGTGAGEIKITVNGQEKYKRKVTFK